MSRIYKILIGAVLSLALMLSTNSCTEVVEPNIDVFGFEYYPLAIGDYKIYYTSIIDYNLDGSVDTTTYLVKELAENSVLYSDGNYRTILGRYSKELDGNKWKKDSIWAVQTDDSKIIISEANVDYVKLTFPVAEEKEWDGNATNAKDVEFYQLKDVQASYEYDTLSYKNTLTVVHKDLVDPAKITEDDYRIEVFAADIGLVHRLKIKINYCSNCVENGKIDDGFIFEQKLIEFGKE